MRTCTLFLMLLVLIRIQKIRSQRRITNGKDIGGTKRYMAYLLKAPISPYQYDEWICGGAIVTPLFIVTSAACVEDIQYMYAIAGYKKYVPAEKINDDPCTKSAKKKVVFTCVPKTYDLDYAQVANWSYIDIAAVRVESPYDFNAPAPMAYCSWVPDMIEINYDVKHTDPGVDVLVYGWGHKSIWRKTEDKKDYNQENLQWGSSLILDKSICKQSYMKIPGIVPVIDRYMICTQGDGSIDDTGRQIIKSGPKLDGCGPPLDDDNNCTKDSNMGMGSGGMGMGGFNYYNFMRRKIEDEVKSYDSEASPKNEEQETPFKPEDSRKFAESPVQEPKTTRRNGICQNDHGGPLVTWVGAYEILIGIASVFLVSPRSRECKGPFLFTSTHCNGAFLGCVLTIFDNDKNRTEQTLRSPGMSPEMTAGMLKREDITRRYRMMDAMNRRMCDLPAEERGFDMVQRRISWMQHPDGPAQNELNEDLLERPQIPLNMFHG